MRSNESGTTPGTDDTPYIRYAIDQLTRDEEVGHVSGPVITDADASYLVEPILPPDVLQYSAQPHSRAESLRAQRQESSKLLLAILQNYEILLQLLGSFFTCSIFILTAGLKIILT